ncbi:hypothetical protein D5b_00503 [Faustovirus]|nr:hypothetical protein D5b_00503 [Faustovirus]AMN84418.1 hypothetical protein D6_00005 [Faustovirus]AMP44441.1 hypothetical protein PRJ_Dakar_00491 [Faustovirus]
MLPALPTFFLNLWKEKIKLYIKLLKTWAIKFRYFESYKYLPVIQMNESCVVSKLPTCRKTTWAIRGQLS